MEVLAENDGTHRTARFKTVVGRAHRVYQTEAAGVMRTQGGVAWGPSGGAEQNSLIAQDVEKVLPEYVTCRAASLLSGAENALARGSIAAPTLDVRFEELNSGASARVRRVVVRLRSLSLPVVSHNRFPSPCDLFLKTNRYYDEAFSLCIHRNARHNNSAASSNATHGQRHPVHTAS